MAWRRQADTTNTRIHQFTGDKSGKRQNVAPDTNNDSIPDSVFILYFAAVFSLLVDETNHYCQQYLDTLDKHSPVPDITESEMLLFLAQIIQTGYDVQDIWKDYWTVSGEFLMPFYSKTVSHDRFLHILRYLHFANNQNAIDNNDPKYYRVWKIRPIFDMPNGAFSVCYAPTEYLAVDEVIVLFKGRVYLKRYILKKHKRFGIKIYKLCDMSGYMCDMDVYLRKNRTCATTDIMSTHATDRHLTRKGEGRGHKQYKDNFFHCPTYLTSSQKLKIVAGW
jgi:hypothetical protein